MKMFPYSLLATAAFVAALVTPRHALAATIFPIESPQTVKDGCSGTYYPPTSGNGGVYGCVNSDGHGESCGGSGKDSKGNNYSTTCTAYAAPPKRVPTQKEVQAVARAMNQPINRK